MLLLISVTIGDVHAKICLDGQEPAVSFHFENLNGHTIHEGDEQELNDLEYELSVNALKVKHIDCSPFLLESGSYTHIPILSGQQLFVPILAESFAKDDPALLLPPLRAPPVIA